MKRSWEEMLLFEIKGVVLFSSCEKEVGKKCCYLRLREWFYSPAVKRSWEEILLFEIKGVVLHSSCEQKLEENFKG